MNRYSAQEDYFCDGEEKLRIEKKHRDKCPCCTIYWPGDLERDA